METGGFRSPLFYLFILFLAVLGLQSCTGSSLVAKSTDYFPVAVLELLIKWLLQLRSMGSRAHGFQMCHAGSLVALPES